MNGLKWPAGRLRFLATERPQGVFWQHNDSYMPAFATPLVGFPAIVLGGPTRLGKTWLGDYVLLLTPLGVCCYSGYLFESEEWSDT